MTAKIVNIIKHENPAAIKEHGDILFPFSKWEEMNTGGNWYDVIPDDFLDDKPYYPLSLVHPNSWKALSELNVNCDEFKKSVEYTCPYNGYIHYWAVPIVIFTNDIPTWTAKHGTNKSKMYENPLWMKRYFPLMVKNGLSFTKIQRSMAGSGHTETNLIEDGNCYLNDAIVALDNEDFLGVKVWTWFNK